MLGPGLIARLAERLELRFYNGAAGVTAQSQEIVDSIRLRSRQQRLELVTNGVDPAKFEKGMADDSARAMLGTEPGPLFIYAGLLGFAQGLDQILTLAKGLSPEIPGRFVIIGDGPRREALAQRISAERITRVKLLPSVPRNRIPVILACADVAIISLGMNLPGAIPSKIYEAMASSLPILLIAEGEAAARVRNADCGLTVPPGSPVELRSAFERLAGDAASRARLGANGRMAAESVYSRSRIAERLDTFLRLCLPPAKTKARSLVPAST
jgi:glycosyltransferase involved in cell wall biosynthesis